MTPYDDEWVKEMMRFKKIDIIKILRGKIIEQGLRVDAVNEAAKILKAQRDEAYTEIIRLKRAGACA